MNAQETIASFLRGEMDIISFRKLYDENPEINDFLQEVVEEKKRTGEPFKKHRVRIVDVELESDANVSFLARP